MKKNSFLIILGIITGLGYMGRTLTINHIRQQERQAQESLLVAAKTIDASKQVQSIHEENIDTISKILESIDDEENKGEEIEYQEYVPIDGVYSLAKVADEYNIMEIATKNLTKLTGVDIARVCYVKNENDDSEFNGVFIHKEGRWYFIDIQGNILADLEDIEVLEKSKFVIRGDEILLEE